MAIPDGWSGFSVGVGVGAASIDQSASADAWRKDKFKKTTCYWYWGCDTDYYSPKAKHLSGEVNDDSWKVFGTVQVGYDRLIHERFLIGAFADYDFYPDGDEHFSDGSKHKSLTGDIQRDGTWTVGGRLGYLVTPRVLLYGLGGYSQMNLNGDVTAEFDGPKFGPHLPTSVTLHANDLQGWTVGGGIESKLDRIDKRLSLKVEYRYSQFDGESVSGSDAEFKKFGWSNCWSSTEIKHWAKEKARLDIDDTNIQSVRAVLVWKLQADATPVEPLK